jgi:hypothetical protein
VRQHIIFTQKGLCLKSLAGQGGPTAPVKGQLHTTAHRKKGRVPTNQSSSVPIQSHARPTSPHHHPRGYAPYRQPAVCCSMNDKGC